MKAYFFLTAVTIILLESCGGKATTQTASVSNNAIAVRLLPLTSESSSTTIEASGLLATEDEASLSFKIGGIINNILVTEGQMVKQGQLLATLKSTEIGAQVQQVQLSVDKAQRDFQRAQNLYKDSVATLEQLQNAQTGLDLARESYRQVAFNRQYASIYAPADGFIVKKLGNAGELASPGSTVLIMNAISGSSRWVLKTGLPDKEWAMIRKGNKAVVQFDAFEGKTFSAVVSKKALAANAADGSFEVELQVEFSGVQPGAGMFGRATIYPGRQQALFSIPYEALLEANGKEGFVFVSNDKRTVKRVTVHIGDIQEKKVTITGGLQGHSFLVTSGSPYLTDGARIMVVP